MQLVHRMFSYLNELAHMAYSHSRDFKFQDLRRVQAQMIRDIIKSPLVEKNKIEVLDDFLGSVLRSWFSPPFVSGTAEEADLIASWRKAISDQFAHEESPLIRETSLRITYPTYVARAWQQFDIIPYSNGEDIGDHDQFIDDFGSHVYLKKHPRYTANSQH